MSFLKNAISVVNKTRIIILSNKLILAFAAYLIIKYFLLHE